MQQVFLKTIAQNPTGTYGALVMNESPLCVTVERPWLNNRPEVSCVPRGLVASFSRYLSPKNGVTWITQDFPGRSNIEIHAANIPLQVEGCFGVGQYFALFSGVMGVANAQPTMQYLRKVLPDHFQLQVQ